MSVNQSHRDIFGTAAALKFEHDKRRLIASMFGVLIEPRRVGTYVLVEQVGRGGMGVVYAAYDELLERKVAIKVLDDTKTLDSRTRLLREAQAMARVSHPNVISIFEIQDDGERAFIVMEFVRGSTLRAWLDAELRTPNEIREAFLAAGRGLAAAHAEGLIHRDFKPQNVMVHEDGRVLVMDLGLARLSPRAAECAVTSPGRSGDGLTQPGSVMGTPRYMSPEQSRGESVDARSDQFSFCVALWEALTGSHPFGELDPSQRLEVMARGQLATQTRGMPRWIRRALVRGLAFEPQRRWASMTKLLERLGRDPQPRRRFSLLGVGLAALFLGLRPARVAVCEARANSTRDAWNPITLEERFLATGVGYAEDTWRLTNQAVSDYLDDLLDQRIQTCRDVRVIETRQVHRCLSEREAELRELLEDWETLDETAIERATEQVLRLENPRECVAQAGAGSHGPTHYTKDEEELRKHFQNAREDGAFLAALELAKEAMKFSPAGGGTMTGTVLQPSSSERRISSARFIILTCWRYKA